MPTSASNSGSGRKIASPRCSPSNRWLWQGDGLPLATQNTTVEDLEQFFGAYRYHDRRTTGRKVASPGLVLNGSVCVIAAAATRLHTYSAAELAPHNVSAWQELRQARETRRRCVRWWRRVSRLWRRSCHARTASGTRSSLAKGRRRVAAQAMSRTAPRSPTAGADPLPPGGRPPFPPGGPNNRSRPLFVRGRGR